MKKIFLVSLLLATTNMFAQSAAVTLAVANKVVAKTKSAERNIARGAPLGSGDAVITFDKALASLKYSNGTFVDLGERTDYKILSYQPKQADITIRAELLKGKIHSKTSGKLKETLKTPVVALSILGTEYNAYLKSPTRLYVKVIEGRVMARGKVYTAGQSFMATPNTISSTPFPKEGYVPVIGTSSGFAFTGTTPTGTTLACNDSDTNCINASDCRVDVRTVDNIDVVDTSLFLGYATSNVTDLLAAIA